MYTKKDLQICLRKEDLRNNVYEYKAYEIMSTNTRPTNKLCENRTYEIMSTNITPTKYVNSAKIRPTRRAI
jgi:hypothetical protein